MALTEAAGKPENRMKAPTAPLADDGQDRADTVRLLVFVVAGHEHAVHARQVLEIRAAPDVLSVAEAFDFVEGAVKIRSKTVPAINVAKRLGLPAAGNEPGTCIVVCDSNGNEACLLVESAVELLEVACSSIEPAAGVIAGTCAAYIAGVVNLEHRLLVVLSLDALLACGGPSKDVRAPQKQGCPSPLLEKLAARSDRSSARKIIAFELDDRLYGVHIASVSEIMTVGPVMPVPNVPAYVAGLINIRGTIMPLIDLSLRIGLESKRSSAERRIIVVMEHDLTVGVLVGRVRELLRLPPDRFQAAPADSIGVNHDFYKEVVRVNSEILVVLDIGKILKAKVELTCASSAER